MASPSMKLTFLKGRQLSELPSLHMFPALMSYQLVSESLVSPDHQVVRPLSSVAWAK